MKCVSHKYQNYPEGGNFPDTGVTIFYPRTG